MRKVFTVEASKSNRFQRTEYQRSGGREDYGVRKKEGARHDTMETHTCRYTKDSGDILCAGDVEIILLSAENEFNAAGGKTDAPTAMKIETKGVSFNRASGEAKTDEEVRFTFRVEAVGVEAYYTATRNAATSARCEDEADSRSGRKRQIRNGRIEKRAGGSVTGSRMDLSRDAGTFLFGRSGGSEDADISADISGDAGGKWMQSSMRAIAGEERWRHASGVFLMEEWSKAKGFG